MKSMKSIRQTRGFTVIELIVAIVLIGIAGWLFYSERLNADAIQRDSARKIAINAMYYNLEEVYYAKNNYYPTSIDSKVLRAMDPGLFTDPTGTSVGELGANYTYDGANCTPDGKCSGYTLRSIMEREADYVKKNRATKQ